MSTISGLLLRQPEFAPFDLGRTLTQATNIHGGQLSNQTRLLELEELKRNQAAQALAEQYMQQHPEAFFGGGQQLPMLSTLGQPAAGAGPLTQTTTRPGQPPGAPQVVPGGQDLSQFATQGGPQSTLGTLGGPQGPPQAPQNPLIEMAQRNPQAALLLQKQLLGQEDLQFKRQEQRLQMGTKVLEHVGRLAQGVSDQASLDAMRSDLISQGLGKYAAQLPQTYSKEAMTPFIAKALDVKESMTLQVQDLQAQAAVIKARREGRSVDVDNQLRAMGVQPGQETPAQIKEALKAVEDAKVRVSASHGTGQIVKGPTGEYVRIKPGTDQVEVIRGPGGEPLREKPSETEQKGATLANSVAAANTLATELEDKGYKPSVWDKGMDKLPLGLGNYLTSGDYQKYRQTVREFASAWLYGVSGAQITETEWENANQTFFPQPNEDKGAVELKRQRRAALVEELRQQTKATGRTGTQGQPQASGSGASPAPLKPVGEMSVADIKAEIAALRAKQGGN